MLVFLVCLFSACSEPASTSLSEQVSPAVENLPPLPVVVTDQLATTVKQQFDQMQDKLNSAPDNGRHNVAYARLLHAYSLYAPANVMYERCIQLRPSDLHCLYLKAITFKELGNEAAAIELLESLLSRSKNYPRAAVLLADSYRLTGRLDDALAQYQQLASSKTLSAEASYGRAQCLLEKGDLDQAKTLLIAMLKKQHYGAVHAALANVYRSQAEQELAQEHLQLATVHKDQKIPFIDAQLSVVQELQIGPARYSREGAAHYRAGRYQDAIVAYLKVLESDPDNDSGHANLVGLYGELGQISNARMHYDAALRINPANILTYKNMGTVLLKRGEFADASEQFAQVLERQPHHAEARTLKNYSLTLRGLPAERSEYEQAIKDDPNLALANYLLGRDLARENCTAALPYLQQSIVQESAGAAAYYADLALCYQDLQRNAEAEQALVQGLRLAEKFRNQAAYRVLIQLRNEWADDQSGQ